MEIWSMVKNLSQLDGTWKFFAKNWKSDYQKTEKTKVSALVNVMVYLESLCVPKLYVKIFWSSSQQQLSSSTFCISTWNEPKWKNGSRGPLGLSRLSIFGWDAHSGTANPSIGLDPWSKSYPKNLLVWLIPSILKGGLTPPCLWPIKVM